jgi:hypothetical protein
VAWTQQQNHEKQLLTPKDMKLQLKSMLAVIFTRIVQLAEVLFRNSMFGSFERVVVDAVAMLRPGRQLLGDRTQGL